MRDGAKRASTGKTQECGEVCKELARKSDLRMIVASAANMVKIWQKNFGEFLEVGRFGIRGLVFSGWLGWVGCGWLWLVVVGKFGSGVWLGN